ncbi:histidine phosphatase family protein [Frigidibacter sp. MR17.24]|uniref:histidine phosphatase family protein n=1 Tax=Frigidibacter sp. MR17.24 TaxID=3127345 RepID=UPI0030131D57
MTGALRPRAFVVIRHGQTDANRDGLIAGRTEAMLTEAGRAAAARLALRRWPARIALFASPQARALDTADLAFPGRARRVLPDLRERDWGRLEGRPLAEITPREATPPEGEPWADMVGRIARALRLAQDAAGPALPVLVAHSGVIRAVRALTAGDHTGPSAPNTTPLLFAPGPRGWSETTLTERNAPWTA